MKRFFAVIIALVLPMSVLSGCGEKQSVSSIPDGTAVNAQTTYAEVTYISDETTVNFEKETTSVSQKSTEAVSRTSAEETTAASSVPATVEDIVAYFNTSINKIKPTAKKVVKNYEKRIVNEDKLVLPRALESVAPGMISTFMKDDTEPIMYETREDITNEFIVPGKPYSSRLEAGWVKSATCKDNGNQYIIHIKLKNHKNPVSGDGVGAVCDVIEAHEIEEKASFIKKFNTEYCNCEVIATVDKASGNTVHIRYVVPVVLEITVDMFGTHDAAAGLTFEKDYTITY